LTTLQSGPDSVYDVLGIGFGPANLALAIALHERGAAPDRGAALRAGFLERQPRFGWHRGMLIDDATMQVSFLKDLVTMRDPTSDFSFLCYLRERGRLVDFLNQKTLFPLRVEFHDYLEWAAARVGHLVEYAAEAVSVRPVTEDGEVRYFDVVSRDPAAPGRPTVRRARALCLATGLEPRLPPGAVLSDLVWHSSELLPKVERLTRSGRPVRRAVVLRRSAPSSPSTATPPPTTVRSPTGSSTRRPWTCSTARPPRSSSPCSTTTARPTTPWSTWT
jgi:L-ornithine N5-oxygenase